VIASILNALLANFPELLLGSYPVLGNPEYRVKLTLESKDPNYLNQAFERLLSTLPKGAVHRIEGK